ncbi:MAG: preprotein translocase subunit SecY [Lachnospiraceae bacterium]|nr:preprotein translocase subunit SecY [Lachnospiraceae bacterium]
MFKTFVNALKIKDIRTKLLFTFLCLIIIRIGCQLPVPGIDRDQFSAFIDRLLEGTGFLAMLSGGGFEQMSVFALGIGPYITSSIIMQLLTIAIPKLEEMQKDGETGRKKIAEITRYVTIGLAVFEAAMLSINFYRSGFISASNQILGAIVIVIALTGGSAFLMWLGEQITEKGIGNGISVILLINICSGFPNDFGRLVEQFVLNSDTVVKAIIAAVVIVALVIVLTLLVILLQDAQRKISVQYAKKMQGRRMVGGQATFIPLRVNTAGVIPVIFASSLMMTPVIITQLFKGNSTTINTWDKILRYLNQGNWCKFTTEGQRIYSIGLILYLVLLVFFAYFYTAITFNPMEVANNLKKQGGFIPGIRPGRPTIDYLSSVLNYIILIGALGLAIVAVIPIFFTGMFNAQISFGGTSIIIVVGVILEVIKQVETMMIERHYKGFLSED